MRDECVQWLIMMLDRDQRRQPRSTVPAGGEFDGLDGFLRGSGGGGSVAGGEEMGVAFQKSAGHFSKQNKRKP